MDKLTEQYRKQFYTEAREILERLADDILRAEAGPEEGERLNAVFRGIHTIKGSAGSFDLEAIADFAHHFEGMLTALRDGRIELTPEAVDLVLAGADQIGRMVDECSAGRKPEADPGLIRRLNDMSRTHRGSSPEEAQPLECPMTPEGVPVVEGLDPRLPREIRERFEEAGTIGLYLYRIRLCFTSELLENGYDPLVFLANLRASCTAYAALAPGEKPEPGEETPDGDALPIPALEDFSPLTLYLLPTIYAATALTAAEIRDLTFDPSLVRIEAVLLETGQMNGEPLRDFVEGAVEMLESLEKAVLDYETNGSRESLNEIFRVVHSVKGDADMIGLREITAFAHSLESLLERLRTGAIKRTFALVDVILQSVDHLRQSVLKLGRGVQAPEFPPVFETLKQYAAMQEGIDRRAQILGDVPPELAKVFSDQANEYRNLLRKYGDAPREDAEAGSILVRTLQGLASASEGVGLKTLGSQAQRAIDARKNGDPDTFSESLERITAFIESLSGEAPPDEIGAQPPGRTPSGPEPVPGAGELRTMRIDETKVDHFSNLVGELLIARNTYAHLMEGLGRGEPVTRETLKAFGENLHLFSRLTNDIHYGVMSLRMIPVHKIFNKFNRTVRDIGRRQKKSIHLMTGGGEIEIDKKVADLLSDPLVHLVRNACDHGIEPPEERRAAGKSESGTLVISAAQEGGKLIIRVLDDGRGIDRQAIYHAAKRAGFDPPSPDHPDLLDLLFQPGFSTREKISDISGRGVGLDVVKNAAANLGGTVHLTSGEGKGTEAVLSIPTTVGIDAVLFVDSGENAYAIPLESIVETLKLPRKKLRRAGRGLIFFHRDRVLPAGYLESILKGHGAGSENGSGTGSGTGSDPEREIMFLPGSHSGEETLPVVIIRTRRGKFGLIVDRMKKNMEVAMKPLPGILAGMDLFGGVTIMGDGRAMLVLNPDKLVRETGAV